MIELKDVEFSYRKGHSLFKHLNVSLIPGHVYGLLGKNGAGKSTLLKHMSGLLFPTAGKVSVMGYDPTERFPEMLKDVYMIPEEFELPAVSLNTFVARNAVFYPRFDHAQLANHLEEFEIPLGNQLPQMSFGQKKKFLISFGLATNARLLILDEPTNGLDIPSKSQFRKIVAAALDESRVIIISTHQVRDLENLIDSILVLEKGQIIFNRSTGEIAEKLAFEDQILNTPEEDILYSETLQSRRMGIVKNTSGEETRIDLELLFNALVKNHSLLNLQFENN